VAGLGGGDDAVESGRRGAHATDVGGLPGGGQGQAC